MACASSAKPYAVSPPDHEDTMRHLLLASVTAALGLAPFGVAEDSDQPLPPEQAVVDSIKSPLTVSNKKDLTLPTPKVADLARTELWYRSFDGKAWSQWQKHGVTFDAGTPIVWTPPEGIWQIYLRPILTSSLAAEEPKGDPPNPKLSAAFIIDRTAPTASIEFPPPKFKLRGGDKYTIKWTANDPYLRSAPITLLYSRDGEHWDVIADKIANKGSYDWNVPLDMTVNGQLKILVTDKGDNVGSAVNTGLLVDSIKPTGKVVGPQITNTMETTLDLDIKDGGPAGLESAELWVSQDDGTSWTESTWIRDPKHVAWKAPGDGKYRLYVQAFDQAKNQSPPPKGKSDDQFVITVDTTPPLVQLASVIGIVPADAPQAGNKRAFKAHDRVAVQFLVKDANPAPNSVSIYLQTGPDKWQELVKGHPLDQAFRFELPEIETKTARIKVTAADLAGNVGEATAAESFEIQTKVILEDSDDKGGGLNVPLK
jgi:hypothetical protein